MMALNIEMRSRSRQQGVTLITVMLVLIVITLLGISAMRMSLSSLTLATNSQVTNLLFQSADTGFVQLAAAINNTPTAADRPGGILAEASADDAEHLFCVTPSATAATQLTPTGCDLSNTAAHYMSGRAAVLTQVMIKRVDDPEIDTGVSFGSSASGSPPGRYKYLIYSTSVIPAFGSATQAEITNCLQLINDDYKDSTDPLAPVDDISVTDCLSDKGAVFNTQIDEMRYD